MVETERGKMKVETGYTCKVCGEVLPSRFTLRRHMRVAHEERKEVGEMAIKITIVIDTDTLAKLKSFWQWLKRVIPVRIEVER